MCRDISVYPTLKTPSTTAIATYATGMPRTPVTAQPAVAPPAMTVNGAAAAITIRMTVSTVSLFWSSAESILLV